MNTLLRQAEAGNSGSKVAGFNKRRFRVRVGGHTATDPVTEFHGFSGVFSDWAVWVSGLGRVGQGWTGLDRVGQGWAGLGKVGQGRTNQ